jgi:adenine-specific DNA-methyltransferase
MAGRRRAQPSGQQGALPVEDYRHAGATRPNNPPAAIAAEGRTPPAPRTSYAYSPRLDPALRADPSGRADALPPLLEKATREKLTAEEAAMLAEALRRHEPWLEWAGKRETPGFAVDPVALHIHERVSTQAILRAAARQDVTRDLFADSTLSYAQAVKFYQHDVDWANRLILGDSLQVMASLAQRENLAGKVQMIFIDPPYGIKYGSNFQPKTTDPKVGDKQADLTREAETVRAYRDTWRLGVHSYLAYLRDRLTIARKLLTNSGSIFVQIGDENVHRVRALLDEIFGSDQIVSEIVFKKTSGQTSEHLSGSMDYILWYARNKEKLKYRQIYKAKSLGTPIADKYQHAREPSGNERRLTDEEFRGGKTLPEGARAYVVDNLTSARPPGDFAVKWRGTEVKPRSNYWKTSPDGMRRLISAERVIDTGRVLMYRRFLDDFEAAPINNFWEDTSSGASLSDPKVYAVQTSTKVIERCLLMSTDPGDLVLDPTCGSGTSAYVSEKWGRRWITIDTSRVAIAIARQRMLARASFEYYRLKDTAKCPSGNSLRHLNRL